MRPEEVPVQFDRETILLAISAWTMGTTLFPGDNAHPLGQLFAILVGDRLRIEQEGRRPQSSDLLIGFCQHLEGRVPEDIRAEFASLDPMRFDASYKAIRETARESGVGINEFCHALQEIAAVTTHFAENMR